MSSNLTNKIIEPTRLSEKERDALTEELYQVQNQVFDGVDKKTFAKYVIGNLGTQYEFFSPSPVWKEKRFIGHLPNNIGQY